MEELGKYLILFGIGIVLLGIFLFIGGKISFFGKLPGDIVIQREQFTMYIPIATSIILSICLSILFWFLRK
ncbi:MAG: DUF2905 domain-containing protein [Patescibacteria group bacterium]|nr:DUF2905 domain-containing protein [Patescibacteria group bacterium]